MPDSNHTFEAVNLSPDTGFDIRFVTMSQNSPFHWHHELEILYILNGHATVNMGKTRFELNPLDAIVIDYSKIHEVLYALPQTMGICIHVSRNLLHRYLESPELIGIHCSSKNLSEEKAEAYNKLCSCLKELTVLYVDQKKTYSLRSTSLILEILAILVEHFSGPVAQPDSAAKVSNMERLEQICAFVEHNYQNEITLQEAADELGLNKEYFCRFFKQNTGNSFIQYVNQVRINHIYQDLLYTNDGIQEIMERHGFFNQKLFYRMFKDRFECTPREARGMAKNNPYL